MRSKGLTVILAIVFVFGFVAPLFFLAGPALAYDNWTEFNTPGMGDSSQNNIDSMVTFGTRVFAGTSNYGQAAGHCKVWRHNGISWSQVNTDASWDTDNQAATAMVICDSQLFVGTYNSTDGCRVYGFNGGNNTWRDISWPDTSPPRPRSSQITCMAALNSTNLGPTLFVGTSDPCQVWRWRKNTNEWTQINNDYFEGVVPVNQQPNEIPSMQVMTFDDGPHLYVATHGYNRSPRVPTKVFHFNGGGPDDWVQVNRDDGFGVSNNFGARLVGYNGKLLASVYNAATNTGQFYRYDRIDGSSRDWTKLDAPTHDPLNHWGDTCGRMVVCGRYIYMSGGRYAEVWRGEEVDDNMVWTQSMPTSSSVYGPGPIATDGTNVYDGAYYYELIEIVDPDGHVHYELIDHGCDVLKHTVPTITSISPAVSASDTSPGTWVTINGEGFGSTQGTSSVYFGSVPAEVDPNPESWTDNTIRAMIPESASGTVDVTVNVLYHGPAEQSMPYSLSIKPWIRSATLQPSVHLSGVIRINGLGFGAEQGSSTVFRGAQQVTPTFWSNDLITIPGPSMKIIWPGFPTPITTVKVVTSGGTSNEATVRYFPAIPLPWEWHPGIIPGK